MGSIVTSPADFSNFGGRKLFLAGSIEMGKAVDWQKEVAEIASRDGWVVLNPRRVDWDPTWEQSIDNPKFFEQVMWELEGLEQASGILMYLAPGTVSPISLLELGLFRRKMVVVCPPGFDRKGNVDIVCRHYHIRQTPDFQTALRMLSNPP